MKNLKKLKRNQFLAKEGDIDQLVELFKRFIYCQDDWNNISDLGKKFVDENHNAQLIGGKMEDLYDFIINEAKNKSR